MAAISSHPQVHRNYLFELLDADKARSVEVFSKALFDYLSTRPLENLATVERSLRDHHCWTRLIAALPNPNNPLYPPRFRDQDCLFELFISTKDPSEAMRELVERSGNEQLNLSRLEVTGVLVAKNSNQINSVAASEKYRLTQWGQAYVASGGTSIDPT